MQKAVIFALLLGLAGASAGVGMFVLSGSFFSDNAMRAVTGGLAAVVVPLLAFLFYFPKLPGPGPKE